MHQKADRKYRFIHEVCAIRSSSCGMNKCKPCWVLSVVSNAVLRVHFILTLLPNIETLFHDLAGFLSVRI